MLDEWRRAALNPQHTVPTLVDGDFSVWESRAISRFLIGKSEDKSLYPEDLKTRALVDQRLDFDLGTLYPRFAEYFFPQVFDGKQADLGLLQKLEQALTFLDAFLDGHKYAVGETLTLADLSLVATVSTIDAAGISLEPYPRVANMPIDLYYSKISAPCRAVMLLAKVLGVELNLKTLDVWKGEHMTPEYMKLNPQHTIPTMVDEGFVLWESRAIMVYLVNKYGKDSNLYPEEAQARALVDQRLYFDIGTLYQRFADYTFPQLFTKAPADVSKLKRIEEALEFLETFLEGSEFVAGDHVTLADLTIVVTVSNFASMNIDVHKYPKIKAWYALMKNTIPGYEEVNGVGSQAFEDHVKSTMRK